jgi:multicomponent Na+:H+ antiporter subunit E
MSEEGFRGDSARFEWRAAALWFVAALPSWWILTGGDERGHPYALPAAALTALAGGWLAGPHRNRLRLRALPGFVVFFLSQSLQAGLDVSRRVLSPRMPLSPGFLEVPSSLPAGAPRWLLASTLNLLPGTLSVEIGGDRLLVHVLDRAQPIGARVAALEARVAQLFVQEGRH